MAVSFDAGSGTTDGTSAPTTRNWAHTVGASASLLLVYVHVAHGGTFQIDQVSWQKTGGSVQNLTQLGTYASTSGSSDSEVDVWYLWSPATGAGTITAANSLGGNIRACYTAQSFVGALSLGSVTTAQGTTSTTPSATGTGTGANDMLASAVCAIGSTSSPLPTTTGTSQTRDSAQSAGISTQTLGAVSHQPGTAGASSWSIPSESTWVEIAFGVLATAPATARRPAITIPRRAPLIAGAY